MRISFPEAPPRSGARADVVAAERDSQLEQLAPLLDRLASRHPELSGQVIRQEALDVLCASRGAPVSSNLVARLVQARLAALS